MKKLLLSILLIFFLCNLGFAQAAVSPEYYKTNTNSFNQKNYGLAPGLISVGGNFTSVIASEKYGTNKWETQRMLGASLNLGYMIHQKHNVSIFADYQKSAELIKQKSFGISYTYYILAQRFTPFFQVTGFNFMQEHERPIWIISTSQSTKMIKGYSGTLNLGMSYRITPTIQISTQARFLDFTSVRGLYDYNSISLGNFSGFNVGVTYFVTHNK
jgi:hypothetical protein